MTETTRPNHRRIALGWMAVVGSISASSFWAYWGILENFHEGWYHHHLGKNLLMLFGQYLSPMLIFMAVGLISVRWRWAGALLHLGGVGFVLWFFRAAHPQVLAILCIPLVLLALGFGMGSPQPQRLAYLLLAGIPFLVAVGFGIEPAHRTWGRIDDMDRSARRLSENGVDLIWAPQGPGWPTNHGGVTWDEAVRLCRHLSADGKIIMESPQDVWRLPTIEEFVRSQHRGGENCEATWNAESARPNYPRQPDKESPLWATDSNVIYWWTGTEAENGRAYKVAYNGFVKAAGKSSSFPYWGFRAVKPPQ